MILGLMMGIAMQFGVLLGCSEQLLFMRLHRMIMLSRTCNR